MGGSTRQHCPLWFLCWSDKPDRLPLKSVNMLHFSNNIVCTNSSSKWRSISSPPRRILQCQSSNLLQQQSVHQTPKELLTLMPTRPNHKQRFHNPRILIQLPRPRPWPRMLLRPQPSLKHNLRRKRNTATLLPLDLRYRDK
jgi:hypothetical protein